VNRIAELERKIGVALDKYRAAKAKRIDVYGVRSQLLFVVVVVSSHTSLSLSLSFSCIV
jgi:t-SNARE complex subunit (syntaxin)